jgi:hypothetical protein
MQRSFLDLLILLVASAAIEAYLSGIRGPVMTIVAGLGLPVVFEYKLEALIVAAIWIAMWLSG